MNHIALFERSSRLQKMVAFLKKRGNQGATTWAIYYLTRICGIPQTIGQLRHDYNGFKIDCVFVRERRDGTRIYRYFFKGRKPKREWMGARKAA